MAKTIKIVVSIISLALAGYTYLLWVAWSHGHTVFRPNMPEDWIISSIILLFIGIPIFFILQWLLKKNETLWLSVVFIKKRK